MPKFYRLIHSYTLSKFLLALSGILFKGNSAPLTTPVKYGVVGLAGQAVDYLLTVFLANVLLPLVVANSVGYICGSVLAYVGHSKFTFVHQSKGLGSIRQVFLFFLTCLAGALFGSILLIFLVKVNIPVASAKLVQLIVIAIVQYLLNSSVTFRSGC